MDMKQLKNLLKNKAKFETTGTDEVGMHTCWIAYETICELEQMRDEKVSLDVVKELTGKATELRLENERLEKQQILHSLLEDKADEKITQLQGELNDIAILIDPEAEHDGSIKVSYSDIEEHLLKLGNEISNGDSMYFIVKKKNKELEVAIQYYLDVLAEARGEDWDKNPDHVLKKMLDAMDENKSHGEVVADGSLELCEIYFRIASEAIGEKEVRKKREVIIAERNKTHEDGQDG